MMNNHLSLPVTQISSWLQDVTLWTHRTSQGHDNLLSEGINGRIGHLGEQLLEVLVDDWLVLGETS